MSGFLAFEWLKLAKRWMPRVILILVLGLLVVAFWGQGTRIEDRPNLIMPRGLLASLIFVSFFAPFFWPVLGGSWAGNEYGWGTIRMVLTRKPYRIQHVVSALIVLLVAVGLSLLAVLLVGSLAGITVGLLTGTDAYSANVFDGAFVATLVKSFLAAWYVAAFYLVLAYTAATMAQSAAVGIGIGIGSTLAEIVLRAILVNLGGAWKTIAEHFPFMYTNELTSRIAAAAMTPGTRMATVDAGVPGVTESIAALSIFMVILLSLAFSTVRARDVTA